MLKTSETNANLPNPFASLAPEAIYIHVPFCESKCSYCNFYSFISDAETRKIYAEAIVEEIYQEKARFLESGLELRPITSIYFGGGTPSTLELEYLEIIFEGINHHFELSRDCEITFEANPTQSLPNKLAAYRLLGINRLSLGLQSTHDDTLRQIGRNHTFKDCIESVKAARNVGFENISLDLIIGLPYERLTSFRESLERVLALKPPHLSYYSLQLEEGTPLGEALLRDSSPLPTEEAERAMYHYLLDRVMASGMVPYEISNAALPGFESRHNSLYWRAEPYFAFGPGASCYVLGRRRSNIADFARWVESVQNYRENLESHPKCGYTELIDGEEARKEFVLLAFRMRNGFSSEVYAQTFGEKLPKKYQDKLSKLVEQQLIVFSEGNYALTLKGMDFANQVFREFI